MAIVGDAYVVVHAITSGVKKDIENGFKGVDREAENAGKRVSRSFSKGFSNTPIANSLSGMFGNSTKEAIRAADAFKIATQTGYFLGSAITAAVGAIGALANGLVSLVAVTLAAAPAFAVLTNAIFGLAQVGGGLAIAFRGVSTAIQAGVKAGQTTKAQTLAITKATLSLKRAREDLAQLTANAAITEEKAVKSLADAQRELNLEREKAAEQIQQLAFDSEDAAISEQKAALDLEKARETLARVSDLPPNSRARKEAELAFQQADLNYRRAIDKNNDLKKTETKNAAMGNGSIQDQIAGQQDVIDASYKAEQASVDLTKTRLDNTKSITRATEDLAQQEQDLDHLKEGGSAADAYATALNNLSASAQEFVTFMVGLKGTGKDLQEAIGAELFPKLETAITTLKDKLLPVLKPLLADLGSALGDVATHLANVLTRSDNLKRIKDIWETNDEAIVILGDTVGNLIDSFLLLADAARPLVLEFANWTKKITGAWKETLEADTKSGKLSATLETAADVVRRLGKLFGATFGAIGNLVSANVGPGSGGYYLLDYLTKAMTGLKNLTEVDGTPLREFFLQGAINAGKVLDVLGFLVKEILKIGASKEFGSFVDSIKAAEPAIQTIVEAFTKALPSFGTLIKNVAEFVAIVTSGDSIKIFFDILSKGIETVNNFLKTGFGQALVNAGNYIIPFIAALALLGSAFGFFEKVIIGNIAKLEMFTSKIPGLTGFISKLKQEITFLSYGVEFASVPFLAIAAAIAAVVAILVIAYTQSEVFRNALKDLVGGVLVALKEAFDKINDAIKAAIPQVDGLMGVFKTIGDFLGTYIVPIFKTILVTAINIISSSIVTFINLIKSISDNFQAAWDSISKIKDGILKMFKGDFIGGLKDIFGGIADILTLPFKNMITIIKATLNNLINVYNSTLGKLKIELPKFLGGGTIGFPKIPNLAAGGIIQPTAGGTLARIGEAGKSERVEPLDPQGLSTRDRAIIAQLSGNSGATVNMVINPSPGMDERELAAIVSRQISYQLRKGAA